MVAGFAVGFFAFAATGMVRMIPRESASIDRSTRSAWTSGRLGLISDEPGASDTHATELTQAEDLLLIGTSMGGG